MTTEFYPINTPLINYFFYKAPFVTNNYVLSNFEVDTFGSGYAIGDIIVCGGGTYTSPAVLKVTGITSGTGVLSVIITSGGQYLGPTPTSLTQASTNGSGSGVTFSPLSFSPNLNPPGPNIPLAGGFLYFYDNDDHNIQLPTYSDISDPNNPVVNTDPIQLGAAGECPLFYLEPRSYYIVITDNTGDQQNPVTTINNYNPAESSGNSSNIKSFLLNNFLANSQFNFPIEFWKSTDEPGDITLETTQIAWAWGFRQDPSTTSKNNITFENVISENIPGNPINQLLLKCETASINETKKDIYQRFGSANFFESQTVTFSAQMVNKLNTTINVDLLVYVNYGSGGSLPEEILLTSFSVDGTRSNEVWSFEMPSLSGKTVPESKDAFIEIIIRAAVREVCLFGLTNVLLQAGNVVFPIYQNAPEDIAKAKILGNGAQIESAGLPESYLPYYYLNGNILPISETGTIVVQPKTANIPFRVECDGSNYKVNDYHNNIPLRRLYDVIHNDFGGGGELIVSAKDDLVTFTIAIGGRAKSTYLPATTSFVINNPILGLDLGIDLTLTGTNTVSGSFYDKFAPDQTAPVLPPPGTVFANTGNGLLTYWGTSNNAVDPNNISFVTTNPGSGVANATFDMTFNNPNPQKYMTISTIFNGYQLISSFIDFSQLTPNTRTTPAVPPHFGVNRMILFSLDGYIPGFPGIFGYYSILPYLFPSPENRKVVDFKSTLTLTQNIQEFIKVVANPFVWTLQVNNIPAASTYFLCSSKTIDYYGWFKVDGVGTDPAVAGRTGVEIDIFTGYTQARVAQAIADAFNTLSFDVPAEADLVALGNNKLAWYITL